MGFKPELLAPAGGPEALEAAVKNGADAIYMGLAAFGARQNARNFSRTEAKNAIDFCHRHGVKTYITMNTLVGDMEMQGFLDEAGFMAREGADALIVQDLGAATLLKKHYPTVPVHASTQMTVHNMEGAMLAKELGFARVILSRELEKNEIEQIVKCGVETEIFVHGALCYSYSGQCLMSSVIGCRSGNRGKCAQPCRMEFTLLQKDQIKSCGYLLNTYDLCLATCYTSLMETGVASLKIEGRMKGADYVGGVVSVYRKCIDQMRNASKEEYDFLKELFCRGEFTQGFFAWDGKKGMIRKENSNEDLKKPSQAKTVHEAKFAHPTKINICVSLYLCKNPTMTVCGRGITLTHEINCPVEPAKQKAIDKETVIRQIGKIGDYPAQVTDILVNMDENIFVPTSILNALRRGALEKLFEAFLLSSRRELISPVLPRVQAKKKAAMQIVVQVSGQAQAEVAKANGILRIYIPAKLIVLYAGDKRMIPVFPDIIKDSAMPYYAGLLKTAKKCGYAEIMSGNSGILRMAKAMGFRLWGGSGLQIFNTYTADFWAAYGLEGAELSRELKVGAVNQIAGGSSLKAEVAVYGRYTLMQTAFCPMRAAHGKCTCKEDYALMDRKDEKFPLECNPQTHTVSIYNAKPLYMGDKVDDIKNISGLKVIFTDEDEALCQTVFDCIKSKKLPDFAYTRGHYYRGV